MFLLVALVATKTSFGQTCSTLGQNPTTAFPVCGKTVFQQNTVPICGGRAIPTPTCNDKITYSDINPFWYKFTCFVSGTLGFILTPINNTDDYDWELFDITGHDPMEVYTNSSLIISANWSGALSPTGTSTTASNWYQCATSNYHPNPSPWSAMPSLIAGHNYILLVSNFSQTQVGYNLAFQGGTASIIDPNTPFLTKAHAVCDGNDILIMLNKKMNCNSVSSDGTDFSISGTIPNAIVSATGRGCAFSFDTDTIDIKLQTPLYPGTYTVTSKTGTDNNSLVDNCDNQLPLGLKQSLVFTTAVPTPMDSLTPIICIQDTLRLVFKRPMECNSIADDGSDFLIRGPSSVTIKSANGVCKSGLSEEIQIVLTNPIKTNGNYQLVLQNGTDGNGILNECGMPTAIGATINFSIQNVTTASITNQIGIGCKYDTLSLSHNGNNGANSWNWQIGTGYNSTAQNPVFKIKDFGKKIVQLSVSNGFCTDTSSILLDFIDHTAKAGFTISDTICLKDSLLIIDNSSNNSISWYWDFGNGISSSLKQPIGIYYETIGQHNKFTVKQIVQNNFNCADTSFKSLLVMPVCYIDIPTGFTPNGDGLNDYLYPLNAFKATDLYFKVYNRYGQVIFETNDWHKKWDGRVKGELQPSGTYVWTLDYTHRDTGQAFHLKGTTVLIR